jgi:hypothetical protein
LNSFNKFFDGQPFDYNIEDKDLMLMEALKENLLYQYQNCIPFQRLLNKRNFNLNKKIHYMTSPTSLLQSLKTIT